MRTHRDANGYRCGTEVRDQVIRGTGSGIRGTQECSECRGLQKHVEKSIGNAIVSQLFCSNFQIVGTTPEWPEVIYSIDGRSH